jgi:hypothetical protein
MARGFGTAARLSSAFHHPRLGSASRLAAGSHRCPSRALVHRHLRGQRARHSRSVRSSTRVRGSGPLSLRAQSDVHRRLRRPCRSRSDPTVAGHLRARVPVPPAHAPSRAALRRTGPDPSVWRSVSPLQVVGTPMASPIPLAHFDPWRRNLPGAPLGVPRGRLYGETQRTLTRVVRPKVPHGSPALAALCARALNIRFGLESQQSCIPGCGAPRSQVQRRALCRRFLSQSTFGFKLINFAIIPVRYTLPFTSASHTLGEKS